MTLGRRREKGKIKAEQKILRNKIKNRKGRDYNRNRNAI